MRDLRALPVAVLVAACGTNQTPQAGPDAGDTLACLPDLDGAIRADEMPVGRGAAGDYFVSPDGTAVDVAGTVGEDGRRRWDLGPERGDEDRVHVAPAPLQGRWYDDAFPGGQIVVPLGQLEAIYAQDDEALWLLGLASPTPDPETLLVYDAPVAVLRFPLEPGRSYTEVGTVTGGRLDGLPYNGTDTYAIDGDAAGELAIPYLTFEQAQRVRMLVTVEPAAGGVVTTRRQVSFLSECFGEVARAVSRDGEPSEDFTTAAELWRFAL